MKRLLALALCALFACQAGARTLYVDAKRPNNKGNGLSVKKAKKTIQAAINIAKDGDTIVVLAGTYASPLKTNNKRIKIKSKSGADATSITAKKWISKYSLDLGGGTSTSVAGFTVTPKFIPYDWDEDGGGYYSAAGGVRGGSLSNCTLVELGRAYDAKWTISKSKLTACVLSDCTADTFGNFINASTLNRCKVMGGDYKGGKISSSTFSNTLLCETESISLASCVLANCTVADNTKLSMKSTTAYNTIFHKVGAAQFKSKKKNTLKSCYKGSNPRFVSAKASKTETVEVTEDDDYDTYEYDPSIDDYRYYATRTVETPANYHLAKGSPCINKGTKAAAAKKLYGKKDLDGKKRVKGKSVDIGCYEY